MRGRTEALWAIAGIIIACVCSASAFELGCGGAEFTTGSTSSDDSDASEASTLVPEGGAGVTTDSGAGWCATQGTHTFCEDFFHGVPDQLDEIAVGGSIAADTAVFESAPQSMWATTQLLAKGATATAFGWHDFASPTGTTAPTETQTTVSSFFNIDAACFPTSGQDEPVTILALKFPKSRYELAVAVLPMTVELIELTTDLDGGTTGYSPESAQITGMVGKWQNWTVQVNGTTKTVTISVGSDVPFAKASLKHAPILGSLEYPQTYFGLQIKNDTSGELPKCDVHVDDILVDLHPEAVASESNAARNSR